MLTVADILGGGFRLLRERIGAFAIWALLYTVLHSAVAYAMRPFTAELTALQTGRPAAAAPDPAAMIGMFSSMAGIYLLLLLGMLVISVAALRAALRPGESAFAYLRIGMDELRMLGLAVVFWLAIALFYVAFVLVMLAIVFALGMFAHAAMIPGVIALVLLMLLALIYFQVRFSLVFALTMLRRRLVIGESWRLTRGRFWMLFGAYFVLMLIIVACGVLAAGLANGPYLAELARSSTNPAAYDAARVRNLQQLMGPVSITTMLGWLVGGVSGAFWITLGAGFAATAATRLLHDEFADVAAIYE